MCPAVEFNYKPTECRVERRLRTDRKEDLRPVQALSCLILMKTMKKYIPRGALYLRGLRPSERNNRLFESSLGHSFPLLISVSRRTKSFCWVTSHLKSSTDCDHWDLTITGGHGSFLIVQQHSALKKTGLGRLSVACLYMNAP